MFRESKEGNKWMTDQLRNKRIMGINFTFCYAFLTLKICRQNKDKKQWLGGIN